MRGTLAESNLWYSRLSQSGDWPKGSHLFLTLHIE